MLNGYKTKIMIVASVAYAIGGLITGNLDANTALAIVVASLTGYGLYDKIDRSTQV